MSQRNFFSLYNILHKSCQVNLHGFILLRGSGSGFCLTFDNWLLLQNQVFVSPCVLLLYPVWILPVTFGLGFYGGLRQVIKHLLLSDYFLLLSDYFLFSDNFLCCLKCNFLLLNLLTTNLKNATPSTEFQVSWHGRRWLKELGDPEKGFYGWVTPACLPMSFCTIQSFFSALFCVPLFQQARRLAVCVFYHFDCFYALSFYLSVFFVLFLALLSFWPPLVFCFFNFCPLLCHPFLAS